MQVPFLFLGTGVPSGWAAGTHWLAAQVGPAAAHSPQQSFRRTLGITE
jgi:hypothetical protein